MCRFALVLLASAIIPLAGFAQSTPPSTAAQKRLIEFGWDEPDTAFLRRHIAEMEKTPFDGCVFHVMSADPQGRLENFTWLCWGRRAFTEAELKPAADDLKATAVRRDRKRTRLN